MPDSDRVIQRTASVEARADALQAALDERGLDASAAVDELGLVMYAAVMPHLLSTKGLVPDVPGIDAWPWALGNAVFLRFEHRGEAQ